MTIPADVLWCLGILVVTFLATMYFSDYYDRISNAVMVTIMIAIMLFSIRACVGFTEADRAVIDKERAEASAPFTTKTPMADGCVLYYHYGNGRQSAFTTKYVKCENAAVTTERQYECGSGKYKKTCTEQIVTTDAKK